MLNATKSKRNIFRLCLSTFSLKNIIIHKAIIHPKKRLDPISHIRKYQGHENIWKSIDCGALVFTKKYSTHIIINPADNLFLVKTIVFFDFLLLLLAKIQTLNIKSFLI